MYCVCISGRAVVVSLCEMPVPDDVTTFIKNILEYTAESHRYTHSHIHNRIEQRAEHAADVQIRRIYFCFPQYTTHTVGVNTPYNIVVVCLFCDSDHAHRQFEWAHAICFCFFFLYLFLFIIFVVFFSLLFCPISKHFLFVVVLIVCCCVRMVYNVYQRERDTYVLLFDTAVVGTHILKYLYDKNVLHYTSNCCFARTISCAPVLFSNKIKLLLILFLQLVIYYSRYLLLLVVYVEIFHYTSNLTVRL